MAVIELSHMCNCSKVVVEIQKFWEMNFDGIIPKNMIVIIDNLFITCCFDSCID